MKCSQFGLVQRYGPWCDGICVVLHRRDGIQERAEKVRSCGSFEKHRHATASSKACLAPQFPGLSVLAFPGLSLSNGLLRRCSRCLGNGAFRKNTPSPSGCSQKARA